MVGEEPEKEEDLEALILPSTLDGVKLVDAPILFFVLSHKAFTKELEELYRVATEGVEKAESGSGDRKVVDDLGRRFEFLKLVYKYHCAAEDEIISPELDTKIKNVVSTYGLEHKRINDDFNSMFHGLDLLRKESEDFTNLFQELIFSIGSIKSIICEHMLKEEKLVFPLVIKHFPFEEQAKLVWQYMCSMPIGLLEDFLPWMASSLPPSERLDLLVCIKTVVPKEEILQEVVISWLDDKKQSPVGACNLCGNGAELYGGQASNVDILKLYPDIFHLGDKEPSNKVYSSRQNPIDGIHIWNSAITRDIRKVLDKLYQIRCSNTTSNLSSTVVQLQFFSDILIFYSNALDRIFYPMLSEHSPNALPLSRLVDKSQIERLQSLLCVKLHGGAQLSNLLEGLCKEVELLLKGISKNLIFLEEEVCSSIRKNCSYKIQLWLLYAGLQTMPLGLLKCCVLWFCATLSDDQFKIMLNGMTEKCPLVNKHFSSLLHEWAHTGYLGKISMETFIKDLQESFTRGIYFTSEEIREDTGFSNLKLEMQALNKFNTIELERNSAIDHNKRVCNPSSSLSNINEKPEYGGTILHRFFPQMWRNILSVLKHPADLSAEQKVFTLESRPMDHFVFFHKALIRDLNYIVSLSANVAKSFQFDPDIQSHFELLKFLYDIHSYSEDGVVFPALESKGKLKNITQSYIIDHCLESEQFTKVSAILKDLSAQHNDPDTLGQRSIKYRQLCLKLHEAFLSMQKIISEHIHREEIILWPLFRKYFSIEEQEKIVGCMLGGTRAETLQEMIPWLMSSLIQDEQHVLISLWLKATKNTNFDEWLGEWWEGMSSYYDAKDEEGSCCPSSFAVDPLQVASVYLGDQSGKIKGNLNVEGIKHSEKEFADHDFEHSWSLSLHSQDAKGGQNGDKYQGLEGKEVVDCTGEADIARQDIKVCHEDHPLAFKQKELETAIRRVSRDSTLDSQKKSHVIQSLIMSRWIVTQQNSNMKSAAGNDKENLGQYPSYQDSDQSIFGCKHYKRNCKLLAACCRKLFTCIRCHDDLTDHSVDRKDITKMMCMKCLVIQPIGPKCSNLPCNSFSMAKYYCRICKLFENERQIYHCPYCNLCRVGKGLGIDYFHCMNCNACMSRSLSVHICREKCFMDNCPICHEYIFTSSSPVKALPCGHLMHSECFQEYTYTHYTCPICSKSLGDMQVYFKMIDALLAEEKVPEEYSGQIQIILCNDCESRGTSSFHWLYHKCPHCGSYNTRLL